MKSIQDFSIGQSASLKKTFSFEEVKCFCDLTGDHNPLHCDEEFAKKTRFGRCIVHGTFYTAVIGTLMGTKLPGYGTILIAEEYKFMKPVFIDDTITFHLEIVEIQKEKQKIILNAICYNQNNEIVLEGKTITKIVY